MSINKWLKDREEEKNERYVTRGMMTDDRRISDKKTPGVRVGYNHIDHNETLALNAILEMKNDGVELTLDEMAELFNNIEK